MYRRRVSFLTVSWLILCASNAFAAYPGPEPLPVVAGGTGAQTLTQYSVLIGAGTGAIQTAAPGAAGIGLVSAGASANPVFGTTVVAGGGTGLVTVAAHALLVGEGTSNFAVLGPTADSVLVYAAATSDPVLTGTSATADSVLAWGAASSQPAPLAVNNCATALTYSTSSHAFGCNASAGGTVPSIETLTGGSPISVSATNLITSIISMATPAAATINLPTAVQITGWRQCVKDGTTNFGSFNATVKSPTSGTIDGVAGATGVVMNIAHQELCFISDHTNWFVE